MTANSNISAIVGNSVSSTLDLSTATSDRLIQRYASPVVVDCSVIVHVTEPLACRVVDYHRGETPLRLACRRRRRTLETTANFRAAPSLRNVPSPGKRESALSPVADDGTMSTTMNDSEEYYCFRVKESIDSEVDIDNENIVIIPRSYNFDLKKLRTELVSRVSSCCARRRPRS